MSGLLRVMVGVLEGAAADPLIVDAGANRFGAGSGFSACGAVNSNTTATSVSGGVVPYSYQWTQTGTPAQRGPYTVNSPTSANTSWASNPNVCDGDNPESETWEFEVTDSDSPPSVETDTLQVTLTWINLN